MNSQRLKQKLVLRRLERVYCRLQPSKIHGIGIFAIKPIPSGTNPFQDSYMAQSAVTVPKNKVPEVYEKLLEDYHPSDEGTKWRVVSDFPNQPIWTNYLNYSDEPNIELMTDGEWRTLRPIDIGEELLEDPKNLFNDDGSQKEFSVKPGQYPDLN